MKILRKNASETLLTSQKFENQIVTGYFFFFREKKYCLDKSFFQGLFFPGNIKHKKSTKKPGQTFAHFRQLVRQKSWGGPPPLPCLSETKYEQMFFRTEPLGGKVSSAY